MRIGISGFFLDQPTTGSGQYLRALLRHLLPLTEDELVLFYPSWVSGGVVGGLQESLGEGWGSRLTLVSLPVPGVGPLAKVWYEWLALPLACGERPLDLLHIPYFGPPLLAPCPRVVTVHDLIMLVLPQHRGSLWVRWYTTLASLGTRRARLVLADSRCTRDDLLHCLGMPQDRVRVVPLGCELPLSLCPQEEARRWVGEHYGLDGDYILYLGGLDWRKNVAMLIQAFAQVPGAWRLAIAGEPPSHNRSLYPDLRGLVQSLGLQGRVHFLGLVPEAHKPFLYRGAQLFVYPSRYEGFGLPPLEAMTWGVPVVCSRAASLPEVVGDAALLFHPEDEAELVSCLRMVLANESLRRDLQRRGWERARQLPWRRCAELTLDAYRAACRAP